LKIKLLGSGIGASPAVRNPTTNLEAHDAYLLGQQKLARRTSASLTEAAGLFQKAIDLDPNYALAYVGLADALSCLTDYSTLPQGEMLAKAEPLARKAIQLDGRLGEAYASLGELAVYKGDLATAISAYQKAIELSPNYSMAYMWYGNLLQSSDKKKALSMYEKALELDPLSPPVNVNLGWSLLQAGRADEAVARFRRAIEIEPGSILGYRLLAVAYGDALNQPEEALRYNRKAIEADPGNLAERVELAIRLSRMGRWDEAIAECRAISAKDSNFAPAYRAMGEIYARQGRLDEAARWQRKAVDKDPAVLDALVGLFARQLDLGDESGARETQRRIVAKQPDGLLPHIVAYNFDIFRGELNEAGKEVRSLSDNAPGFVRNDAWMFDMRAGRFSEARDQFRSSNPELFDGSAPVIAIENLSAALNVAAAELKLGQKQHAEMLLERCERYIASRDEGTRRASFRLEPVVIDTIRGRKEEALAAFRRAIDDGFRSQWWVVPLDPSLDPIRDDPRFVAMMKEIRADVDRMRKKGTLPLRARRKTLNSFVPAFTRTVDLAVRASAMAVNSAYRFVASG
jgi:tetratricopeptide (TPR) repeat protein